MLGFAMWVGGFLPAQGPAYSIVGDETLSGTDIYSILQLENGDILLSTDRSLLRYDGYDFHAYKNEKQKNQSLFGLSQGPSEIVWCFNLSGQIFSFSEDSLSLFYEIPDSLVSGTMVITASPNGSLIISCKTLLLLSADGKIVYAESDELNNKVPISRGEEVLFSKINSNISFYLKDGRVMASKLGDSEIDINSRISFLLYQHNKDYFLQLEGTYMVYKLEGGRWRRFHLDIPEKFQHEIPMRMFFLGADKIGFPLLSGGILQLSLDQKAPSYSEHWFSEHVISGIIEDREGNWWLGTLGEGLLLVGNPNVEQYRFNQISQGEKLTKICTDGGARIFASSNKGRILSMQGKRDPVFLPAVQSRSILYLDYYSPGNDLLFGTVYPSFQMNLSSGKVSSIPLNTTSKANYPYPGPFNILPSSGALYFWAKKESDYPTELKNLYGFTLGENNLAHIEGIKRSSWAYYDMAKNQLTVGTPVGVHIVNERELKPLEWNGKAVISRTMTQAKGALWLASPHTGLLMVKGEKVLQSVGIKDGLLPGEISKLVYAQENLFILFPRHVQVYTPATGKFMLIDKPEGLSGKIINDITVNGNNLWVGYDRSLRKIPLNKIRPNTMPPILRWSDFRVNGKPTDFGASIDLNTNENNIEFHFLASGFRHQGLMKYSHWLEGAVPAWQSQDFSQNWVKYSSLKPGDYTFHVKAINENGIESEELIQKFSIAPPIWARWWFVLLGVVAIVAIVAAFFLLRIRSINRQNAIIQEKHQVEVELVDSQITAMRSQMNPHFIFNALNSIQEFILLNEKKQASKYLGKFADLMRTYLNHSRQKTVRLSDEISALEIYLDLEKLRFEESLVAQILIEPSLSSDFVRIPSFIIQPHVENALKHGLLHKKGDRKLTVKFEKGLTSDVINCVVEDNGIGRAMAEKLSQSRASSHTPYATESARSRLELLSLEREAETGVEYQDLKDANGVATGTRVILRIPTFRV